MPFLISRRTDADTPLCRQKQSAENNHLAEVGPRIFAATPRVTANPYVCFHPRVRMNGLQQSYLPTSCQGRLMALELGDVHTMIKPPKSDVLSTDEIARTLKLDRGLGFLVRLLDTRVHLLYEHLTRQKDITPRQFGVLLTLYQRGTLTLTELAGLIRVDRSTLGEMINRMAERSLISKRNNGSDRRSAEVLLAPAGRSALFR